MNKWNIFSNHGHVLLFLARNPDARLRDVAANVGITERAVQKIVRDMQESGVVAVTRIGRRNHYAIDGKPTLQHRLEAHRHIGQVVELIAGPGAPGLIDSATSHPSPVPDTRPDSEAPSATDSRPQPPISGGLVTGAETRAETAPPAPPESGEQPAPPRDSVPEPKPAESNENSPAAGVEQRSLF